MKKLVSALIIGLLFYAIYQHFSSPLKKEFKSDNIIPSPTPGAGSFLIYKDTNIGYAFVNNISPENLSLIPNFNLRYPTADLMKNNNCNYGINGGFYSETNKPIGQFVTNGVKISDVKNSLIFNGFITINNMNLEISETETENPQTALQTGPIVIQNQIPVKLNIVNDKLARRMVIGKYETNKMIILTVFDLETKQSGPLLQDLPEIIQLISVKENMKITDAINLDGGRASAFYGNNLTLPETDPVGSWWCVK